MKTVTYNFKVGNDNGNSEHDLIIDGKLVCQPNVLSKVRKLPMLDDVNVDGVVKNVHDNVIVTIDSPECEAGLYFIGRYAKDSGLPLSNIEVGVDNAKVHSDVILPNTLGQIAAHAISKAYPELDREIIVNVDMTTALPVTQYTRKNAKDFAAKFLANDHRLTFHVGAVRVPVRINFDYVKVLPESVPAVFALQGLKRDKESTRKTTNEMFKEFNLLYQKDVDGSYFESNKILHTAIGEGTTEYPLTNDIEFDPNFIQGSNNGVGHAIEQVLLDFIEQQSLNKFSRQDYSAVLRNPSHKYYKAAKEMIELPLQSEAESILRFAKREARKANNEVDILCVHGGGSILLKDFLYKPLKAFGDATGIEVLYIPEKYAVSLEVMGMYEFTNSDIFKVLKEKYRKVKQVV